MLLFPEGALELNESAAKVLELCNGERTVADIVRVLEARYPGADVGPDVKELLGRLEERRFVTRASRPPAEHRP
jgi:pyrroloquinoline quinone biosynthesis protein D